MHRLFADWYRQADLHASADVLNARWRCVEAAVSKLDANAVLQLTRVCFALPKPETSAEGDGASIASVFKDADVSFPMKGNEQLLRILFGVTLAQAIEQDHREATFASLAVTSAYCDGLGPLPAVEELPAVAGRYLDVKSEALRSSSLEDAIALPRFGKAERITTGIIEIQDTPGQGHWAQVHQNFQNLKVWVAQVNAAIEALSTVNAKTRTETHAAFQANAERAALQNRVNVLKEECDVLWWLFGEYSDSLNKQWSDSSASECCVALGREVANLFAFPAPPANAKAFLSKALSRTAHSADLVALKGLLEAGPEAWRNVVAQDVRQAVRRTIGVTPVHTGLVARVDASSRWAERLTELTSLKPDQSLSPAQWALQSCREALLLELAER